MAYSKIRHYRGRKDCGGFKKKCRGAGNHGGRGHAGLHKHKYTWVTKYCPDYFHKPSMKPKKNKIQFINLEDIERIILKEGKKDFDYSDFKILGSGNISKPVNVKAYAFSKNALEKIQKAGGKAEALYVETPEPKKEAKTAPAPKK